jgi:hypothetical protein
MESQNECTIERKEYMGMRVLLIMVKDAMVFRAIIATTRSRRYLRCYQS